MTQSAQLYRLRASALRLELALCRALLRARNALPRLAQRSLLSLTSAHPGADLSCGVWAAGAVAAWELGARAAWLQAAVGCTAFALSQLPPCRRAHAPADADPLLAPPAPRLSPSALLCVEMAVAVAVGYAVVTSPSGRHAWVVAGVALGLAALACARLLVLTHFPHQLLLSAAFGLALCVLCDAGVSALLAPAARVSADVHAVGGMAVLLAAVGYVAARAESNDAPMLRVERREYERMLRRLAEAANGTARHTRTPAKLGSPLPRRSSVDVTDGDHGAVDSPLTSSRSAEGVRSRAWALG